MKKVITFVIAFICVLLLYPMTVLAGEIPESIAFLDKIKDFVANAPGWILLGGGALAEMIFRLIKSKKPLSIAHLIARILHQVAAIMEAVGDILDKILPQKLK